MGSVFFIDKNALSVEKSVKKQEKSIIPVKQLNNTNIMKLYKVIDSTNYLYLIMEYIDGISLLDTIRKDSNHYFEEKRALNIFNFEFVQIKRQV